MRCVGVDIATKGAYAVGLAVNGEPTKAAYQLPSDKKASHLENIEEFHDFVLSHLWLWKPEIISVEQVAGLRNPKVVHQLTLFEGAAILAAKKYIRRRYGGIVLNPIVKQSRAVVIPGKGSVKKEVFFELFKKKYPEFKLSRANGGGMDECDAITHALAAPSLLERRK